MSTAAKGWYVDPSTGTNLRYWNGTTWTDEVAPLPDQAPHVDPFAAVERAIADQIAVERAAAEQAAEQEAAEALDAVVHPPLDPELEHTQLTRRELRARRGANPELDDTPKHLSRVAPLPAVPSDDVQQPEELDIPIAAVTAQPQAEHPLPEQLEREQLESEQLDSEQLGSGSPAFEGLVFEGLEPEHPPEESEEPRQRRTSIVRLSVLLGILAVASSVAVLTAGTL